MAFLMSLNSFIFEVQLTYVRAIILIVYEAEQDQCMYDSLKK